VAALALASAADAVACSCAALPPKQRVDAADAAFVGRLVAVERAPARDGTAYRRYRFLVDGVVKGDLPRELAVLSPADGAACGFELERNVATGILLRRTDDGAWLGGLCGQIGVGELVEASRASDERLVNWGGLVVGGAVVGLGGWLTWRRLQRRRAALAASASGRGR
jgi:hypothetical protein